MIHPHYVFWVVAPVGLLALWYCTPRLSRITYALAVFVLYALVILSGADYSAPAQWTDLVAGVLVTASPFVAVLAVALSAWAVLRRDYPWLPLLLFPLAYYLGFSGAIMLGMAAGIVQS